MLKVAVLIDGGHLRALARGADYEYNPSFIVGFANACIDGDKEILWRVLYYDCAPFEGTAKLPVSGNTYTFSGSDKRLRDLAQEDKFAVRRGVLKFRGFKPKKIPIASDKLKDEDFKPDFEQKGVDMRIGLDIANFCSEKSVDRILLVTGDTDCLPAMKHCRIRGLQIVLISVPKQKVAPELLWHSDFERRIQWP